MNTTADQTDYRISAARDYRAWVERRGTVGLAVVADYAMPIGPRLIVLDVPDDRTDNADMIATRVADDFRYDLVIFRDDYAPDGYRWLARGRFTGEVVATGSLADVLAELDHAARSVAATRHGETIPAWSQRV